MTNSESQFAIPAGAQFIIHDEEINLHLGSITPRRLLLMMAPAGGILLVGLLFLAIFYWNGVIVFAVAIALPIAAALHWLIAFGFLNRSVDAIIDGQQLRIISRGSLGRRTCSVARGAITGIHSDGVAVWLFGMKHRNRLLWERTLEERRWFVNELGRVLGVPSRMTARADETEVWMLVLADDQVRQLPFSDQHSPFDFNSSVAFLKVQPDRAILRLPIGEPTTLEFIPYSARGPFSALRWRDGAITSFRGVVQYLPQKVRWTVHDGKRCLEITSATSDGQMAFLLYHADPEKLASLPAILAPAFADSQVNASSGHLV